MNTPHPPFLTSSQKRLMALLGAALLVQAIATFIAYMLEVRDGALFGGDFTVFWQAAQKLAGQQAGALYDPAQLQAVLDGSHPAGKTVAPFVYPPPIALFLWPLGFLDYATAVTLWSAIPIILFYRLLWLAVHYSQKDAKRLYPLAALYTIPFITANLLSGQTGTWVAVLFLAGVCGWQRKRWWAGVCFGAMIVKPQLGLLLPFAFLASRQWRMFAVATVTVLCLAALATAWLGIGIWADYITMLHWFGRFANERFSPFASMVTAPYMSLRSTGVPPMLAIWAQAIISLFVLMVVIHSFRREEPGRLEAHVSLLACGALLATPHSMAYDSPLLAIAAITLFFAIWHKGWRGLFELAAFVMILAMPYLQPLAMQKGIPFGWVALLVFFIALLRRYHIEYHSVK